MNDDNDRPNGVITTYAEYLDAQRQLNEVIDRPTEPREALQANLDESRPIAERMRRGPEAELFRCAWWSTTGRSSTTPTICISPTVASSTSAEVPTTQPKSSPSGATCATSCAGCAPSSTRRTDGDARPAAGLGPPISLVPEILDYLGDEDSG